MSFPSRSTGVRFLAEDLLHALADQRGLSLRTARWRMSGLDSWDTYDSDFYDPMSTIFAEVTPP